MFRSYFNICPLCGTRLIEKVIENRQRKVCSSCGWIAYDNPLPCAAAFVRNSKGEVLLVKRGVEPGKGEWGLPSGFMEIDETPEEACLRELEEETGLRGKINRLIGVYAQDSLTYRRVLIIGYEVKAQGRPRPGSDSVEVRYFPPEDLPPIVFLSHRRLVEDGLNLESL